MFRFTLPPRLEQVQFVDMLGNIQTDLNPSPHDCYPGTQIIVTWRRDTVIAETWLVDPWLGPPEHHLRSRMEVQRLKKKVELAPSNFFMRHRVKLVTVKIIKVPHGATTDLALRIDFVDPRDCSRVLTNMKKVTVPSESEFDSAPITAE